MRKENETSSVHCSKLTHAKLQITSKGLFAVARQPSSSVLNSLPLYTVA